MCHTEVWIGSAFKTKTQIIRKLKNILTGIWISINTFIKLFFSLHHTCKHAKSLQLYLILCHPMDYSLPGSSVHGILQARIQEWVAMPSSRVTSQPRDQTCIFYISYVGRQILYHWAIRKLSPVWPHLNLFTLGKSVSIKVTFTGSEYTWIRVSVLDTIQ